LNSGRATNATNWKSTRDRTEKSDSRISNKITQSMLENEKAYLKNPTDYEKIIEVKFLFTF
jgi:hypothetical protein